MCVVDSRWPKESYVAVFSNRGLPGMEVLPTRFATCMVEVIGCQCCSRRAGKGDEKKETLFLCRSLLYTHQQHAKWYNRSTQTAAETHSSSTHAHYVPHAHEHTVMLAVLFVDHLVGPHRLRDPENQVQSPFASAPQDLRQRGRRLAREIHIGGRPVIMRSLREHILVKRLLHAIKTP